MTDAFQQFVQTQQIQTQQVQTDTSAVKAIDAGIEQYEFKKNFDAVVNGLGNALKDKAKDLGGKIAENMSKGVNYMDNKMSAPTGESAKAVENLQDVKRAIVPEKTPQLEASVAENARNAVQSLGDKMPKDPVHVADSNMNEVTNSAKIAPISQQQAATQNQSLSV